MKKSFSLIILSLLLSFSSLSFFTVPVSASMDISGTKYYTTEEMSDFRLTVEAEVDELCGYDAACQDAFFEERAGKDPKYNALKIFLQQVLVAASINPEAGDLKVFYHSRNWWFRFEGNSAEQPIKIATKIDINWTDPAIAYTYPIYAGDRTTLGDDWFQPDTELSIHSLSENLNQNTLGRIDYAMDRVNNKFITGTSGGFDYSLCLRSRYYQPGLECRPIFGENTDMLYIPYREGVPAHLYQEPTPPQEPSNPENPSAPDSPSEPEKTLWTVPELAEYEKIAQAEADAACQDQIGWRRSECLWRYREDRQQEGGIARAYNSFYYHNFFITAINPSTESIRIFFRDQDPSEREMYGIENPHPVTEAFIVWYDPTYQENPEAPFMDYLRAGKTIPGMHVVYDSAALGQEPGFFEANRELELVAKNHDLSQNNSSYLEYFINNHPMSSYERADYISECINSPDYSPGKECRLFLDQDGQKHYLPDEALKIEQPSESNSVIEPTSEDPALSSNSSNSSNLQSNSATTSSAILASLHNPSSDSAATASGSSVIAYRWLPTSIASSLSHAITSPKETSKNTSKDTNEISSSRDHQKQEGTSEVPLSGQLDQGGNKGCASEFPWWLILLVLAADIVIMWLFWPRRQEQNTQTK